MLLFRALPGLVVPEWVILHMPCERFPGYTVTQGGEEGTQDVVILLTPRGVVHGFRDS